MLWRLVRLEAFATDHYAILGTWEYHRHHAHALERPCMGKQNTLWTLYRRGGMDQHAMGRTHLALVAGQYVLIEHKLNLQAMTYIVGLTGGIGSGKSTVSAAFARRGVPMIDADVEAHKLVQPGSESMQLIRQTFGPDYIQSDGTLHRALLRQMVFSDPTRLQQLEQILHPRIRNAIQEKIQQIQAPYAILAAPLLLERQFTDLVDRILVVDVAEEEQVRRVMLRDHVAAHDVRLIMQQQMSRQERLNRADDIIDNDGKDLETQIEHLHQQYLRWGIVDKDG